MTRVTPPTAGQPPHVPAELAAWITGIDSFAARLPPAGAFTDVPEPASEILVRAERSGRRDVLVVGPRTRAAYRTDPYDRPVSCLRLRLAPGAVRPLFGLSAAELVDRTLPASALPTRLARHLARELAVPEPEDVPGRLAELLPPPVRGPRERVLRAAAHALAAEPGTVREVADQLAVSERQLRNLFADGIGLSPKHFARISRVRHVLAHASTLPWAELAVSSGYYDQSHMTADFRALMGVPPRAFMTGRLPEPTPCRAEARS